LDAAFIKSLKDKNALPQIFPEVAHFDLHAKFILVSLRSLA